MNQVRHREKGLNVNSALLTVLLAIGGWEVKEVMNTHDAVLRMVPREEYYISITELRTRVAAVEVEVQKWKDAHEDTASTRK